MRITKLIPRPCIDTEIIKEGDKIKFKFPAFSGEPNSELRDEGIGKVLEVDIDMMKIIYYSTMENKIKEIKVSAERIYMENFYIDLIDDELFNRVFNENYKEDN